ncbi:hypothetical protein JVT61DRAFT_10606 [Boletus reticuloceps]|uniref:Uncharacterized protein n=1 Tax=Boletus reticuloceps TaxID=495285 RepID=A0A8I2YGI8_9AGAM|nr:hypothetical protein JVT61DRAFT_10606 [Boletus reticuloceps]
MQSSSGFTFSKFLLVTLAVLMAWTAVAQGAGESDDPSSWYRRCSRQYAAISSKRARNDDIVDFGTSFTVEANKSLRRKLQPRKMVSRGA